MTVTAVAGATWTWTATVCPTCGARQRVVFYEARQVPAHSVLLMPTREEALGYPKGDVTLALCEVCGLISNVTFDPGLHEYSGRYEETQGFSSTFNAFHRRLAERLIQRYDLHGKDVVEIGRVVVIHCGASPKATATSRRASRPRNRRPATARSVFPNNRAISSTR